MCYQEIYQISAHCVQMTFFFCPHQPDFINYGKQSDKITSEVEPSHEKGAPRNELNNFYVASYINSSIYYIRASE